MEAACWLNLSTFLEKGPEAFLKQRSDSIGSVGFQRDCSRNVLWLSSEFLFYLFTGRHKAIQGAGNGKDEMDCALRLFDKIMRVRDKTNCIHTYKLKLKILQQAVHRCCATGAFGVAENLCTNNHIKLLTKNSELKVIVDEIFTVINSHNPSHTLLHTRRFSEVVDCLRPFFQQIFESVPKPVFEKPTNTSMNDSTMAVAESPKRKFFQTPLSAKLSNGGLVHWEQHPNDESSVKRNDATYSSQVKSNLEKDLCYRLQKAVNIRDQLDLRKAVDRQKMKITNEHNYAKELDFYSYGNEEWKYRFREFMSLPRNLHEDVVPCMRINDSSCESKIKEISQEMRKHLISSGLFHNFKQEYYVHIENEKLHNQENVMFNNELNEQTYLLSEKPHVKEIQENILESHCSTEESSVQDNAEMIDASIQEDPCDRLIPCSLVRYSVITEHFSLTNSSFPALEQQNVKKSDEGVNVTITDIKQERPDPELDVPELDVPELDVPELDVPELDIPELDVPEPLQLLNDFDAVSKYCVPEDRVNCLRNSTNSTFDERYTPDEIILEMRDYFKRMGIYHQICTKIKESEMPMARVVCPRVEDDTYFSKKFRNMLLRQLVAPNIDERPLHQLRSGKQVTQSSPTCLKSRVLCLNKTAFSPVVLTPPTRLPEVGPLTPRIFPKNYHERYKKPQLVIPEIPEKRRIGRGRKGVPWTKEEMLALYNGVVTYGEHKWIFIRNELFRDSDRTTVDLSDKWRNIKRSKKLIQELKQMWEEPIRARLNVPSNCPSADSIVNNQSKQTIPNPIRKRGPGRPAKDPLQPPKSPLQVSKLKAKCNRKRTFSKRRRKVRNKDNEWVPE